MPLKKPSKQKMISKNLNRGGRVRTRSAQTTLKRISTTRTKRTQHQPRWHILKPEFACAKALQPDPSPLTDIVLTNLGFLDTVLLARN